MTFALDGTTYELDLSTKNADKFRESFQEWIGAGRKVSTGKSAGRKATKASGGSGRSSEELQEIRAWARDNGYDVPERGRIKQEVLDAYDAS